jgi:hypothetical protein
VRDRLIVGLLLHSDYPSVDIGISDHQRHVGPDPPICLIVAEIAPPTPKSGASKAFADNH